MDYAMNIFRGDVPVDLILAKNDIYHTDNKLRKKFLKTLYFPMVKAKFFGFSPMYNLDFAKLAKQNTKVPIITVGGFREKKEIEYAIQKENIDFVSLCRAIICEPDFVNKLMANNNYKSKCVNCNYCVIMCDTENVTKCYKHG
jgi:2,4-dienoyl-CoA reductase-like NADH-dependent reductase (Old Yellow Enzyme family)